MKAQLLIFNLVIVYSIYSQNLIPNPSFENGNDQYSIGFNANLEGLHDWEPFNSSDWVKKTDQIGSNAPPYIYVTPPTGLYCLGFGPCEGAQVKIQKHNSDIIYAYSLAFKFTPRIITDSKINVYLMNDKAVGISNCLNPSIPSRYHEVIPISSIDHTPLTWYQYVSEFDQAIPGDPNWFALKGENEIGDYNSDKYLLVDDIVYKRYPYCQHPCAGNKSIPIQGQWAEIDSRGNIQEHYGEVLSGMSDLVHDNSPLLVSLIGANYVKLIVGNRWGEIETWEYFNPNGLTNADYNVSGMPSSSLKSFLQNRPDLFTVMWDGTLNGNLYPNTDVYTIRLIIKGCGLGAYEEVIHDVVNTISLTGLVPDYNDKYIINNDCCTPGGRVVTVAEEDYLFYQDFIQVKDDYRLEQDGKAEHFAGNFIELLPETTIELGSYYNAEISTCILGENKTNHLQKSTDTMLLLKQDLIEPIKLTPNPANESVTVTAPSKQIKQLRIYDQFGRCLETPLEAVDESKVKIDVSRLPAGIYIVEIITQSEAVKQKLIVE